MPRFAANLSFLYPELPFLDRFEAAAKDGFKGVEFLFPYAWSVQQLRARLQDLDLQPVLFNAPAAGVTAAETNAAWLRGERGILCLDGRRQEFEQGVQLALRYAESLQCPRIHCMAGVLPADADPARAHKNMVSKLRWAAAQAAGAGIDILIEPINQRDMPGYFLDRQAQAHAIVQEVGADHVKVQMDLYHCQISEGDVSRKIRAYLPTGRIGHFQMASVPDRHEPDQGELNYAYVFRVLDAMAAQCHWQGWVGCEYHPRLGQQQAGTSKGLQWLQSLSDPAADQKTGKTP